MLIRTVETLLIIMINISIAIFLINFRLFMFYGFELWMNYVIYFLIYVLDMVSFFNYVFVSKKGYQIGFFN